MNLYYSVTHLGNYSFRKNVICVLRITGKIFQDLNRAYSHKIQTQTHPKSNKKKEIPLTSTKFLYSRHKHDFILFYFYLLVSSLSGCTTILSVLLSKYTYFNLYHTFRKDLMIFMHKHNPAIHQFSCWYY